MKNNFIKKLCEDAMADTEVALNVDNISTDIQAMIKKITTIKTDTLANLVKKIKYDGNIDKANEFEQNIGQKLDQLLQSMTDIKGEIDNISVGMLTGNDSISGGDSSEEGSDMDDDFAAFEPTDGEGEEAPEAGNDELNLDDFDVPAEEGDDLAPMGREVK